MKFAAIDDLIRMREQAKGVRVSIYMPAVGGADFDKNRIRFKTLVGRAEKELKELAMSPEKIEALLGPCHELMKERPFWQSCGKGFTAFASGNYFKTYHLPFPVKEGVVVGDRFNLRPLEHLISGQNSYFLLALSLGENRLFEATPYSIAEISTDDLPSSMKETLKFDVFEKHLQGHPTASASGTGARMTFHGHGSQKEDRDTNIRRYVREIAGRISTILGGERSPLILAGLPHLLSEFTAACDYPGLLDDHVVVDPGHMKIEELHRRSLDKANGYFRKNMTEALERYGAASAAGSAVEGTVNALKMSARGRVDTLFVTPDLSAYGRFDPKTGETELSAERQPGDSDLVSLAVEETLLKGGKVFTAPEGRLPGDEGIAAILRY